MKADYRVIKAELPLYAKPKTGLGRASTLLLGETVILLEHENGFALIESEIDSYQGYVEASGLHKVDGKEGNSPTHYKTPTHYIGVAQSFLYQAPDIKSHPIMALSLAARLRMVERGNYGSDYDWALCELDNGQRGYCRLDGLCGWGQWQKSPAQMARLLLGRPYLWGGGSYLGYDCSQLVQLAFFLCGKAIPRDTGEQIKQGQGIENIENLTENDLIFWQGHVGIMLDSHRFIHANASEMLVSIWSLDEAKTRFEEKLGLPIIAMKRLLGGQ